MTGGLLGVRAGSLATLEELVAPLPAAPEVEPTGLEPVVDPDDNAGLPLFDAVVDR